MIALIALGWAVIAAGVVLGVARRIGVARRARRLIPRNRRATPRAPRLFFELPAVRTVQQVLSTPWRRRRQRRVDDSMLAALPVAVDLVAVAVGAGCTPYRAVVVAARWSPRPIGAVLEEVDRATAIGSSFDDALRVAGQTAPIVARLTETLRTSARLGSPASASLTRLAEEVRADVRRRAEARARTVPVRLLFPLVFCVLPAFALLTVVPVLFDGIAF